MPYLITTTKPCEECHGQGARHPARAHMSHEVTDCPECGTSGVAVDSRRAVATLEEARQAAYHEVYSRTAPEQSFGDRLNAAQMLPESGGTIGPLPDGTVIDVDRAEWKPLARAAGLLVSDHLGADVILDAYNAAQEA